MYTTGQKLRNQANVKVFGSLCAGMAGQFRGVFRAGVEEGCVDKTDVWRG